MAHDINLRYVLQCVCTSTVVLAKALSLSPLVIRLLLCNCIIPAYLKKLSSYCVNWH
jgi:hypothetical protein